MKKADISLLPPDENDHLFKKTGLKHFANLVRTGLNDLGILHLQFNCIDKQTLIDAQKNPENYPTLLVRVAGYSVYFTDLAKCIQDDIISRTEHRLT
jgi:formate C-acetyltransferase